MKIIFLLGEAATFNSLILTEAGVNQISCLAFLDFVICDARQRSIFREFDDGDDREIEDMQYNYFVTFTTSVENLKIDLRNS